MKTIKIVASLLLFVFLAVTGTLFAASFAVDTLQSWPKALMEARVVLYGQLILGFILGRATGKWYRWLNVATLGATVIALCFYAWYTSELPGGRLSFCISGMYTFVLMGGLTAGRLVREVFSNGETRTKRLATPILAGDVWKN